MTSMNKLANLTFIVADEQDQSQSTDLDNHQAQVLLADLFQWPMQSAKVRQQVGRFALVEYTPVDNVDPDIVIMVGSGHQAFNRAVIALQCHRRERQSPQLWYQNAKLLSVAINAALAHVRATNEEQWFVQEWAETVISGMRTITGPVPPNNPVTCKLRIWTDETDKGVAPFFY